MAIHTLKPTPEQYSYVFGGSKPLLSVKPGDIVEVSTEDCYGGRVNSPDDLPSEVVPFAELNPVSGPIEVEGAEVGDVLAVHFISIVPARPYAVSSTFPHFGALTPTHETSMLSAPLEERVWFYDIDLDSWTATFRARNSDYELSLPLDPMHGTVGVAPASGEVRLVVTPSTHGGNMDTPEVRAGTTLYLPVNVPGAMLSLGDGHARQGEGEVCGTGLESAMNSVIAVDVVKDGALSWPRLEDDEYIMSTGSVRPLEDAYRISQTDLIGWASELTGLDTLDAYQLVSQLGLAPAANVCDPNYTMLAKLPKWALKSAEAYGGVHRRLRAAAEDYSA
ncbi:acetamidase/formamidase family protein [Sinomonas terrae]|uniref:Acetamidase/formamidase family protein n=1 Tax=Sinomonas terrae TaxID=2908838 RepID=A0ABS9U6M6_9MICC|nr:acetamidase/formamidase family protein [Sinomonas terrae]MCH6472324.1 acetamidase/formamidase family protein [Sinomonas terrae]